MDLYHLFLGALVLVLIGSSPTDKPAVRIVLAASLVSWLTVEVVTSRLTGAWKLSVPGAVETLTILCLLRWGGKNGGYQVGCLIIAWFAHVLCFADLKLGTDMVYSNYESILTGASIAQLLLFHDTYLHHFRRLGQWWSNRGGDSSLAVRGPRLSSPVLNNLDAPDP
jgi:hypothetical protein